MYLVLLFIALLECAVPLSLAGEVTGTLCDKQQKICLCKYNLDNNNTIGYYIDCSYQNLNGLKNNSMLPNTAYSLNLNSNKLQAITSCNVLRSNTLKELLLSRNIISKIDPDALDFPNLILLDLSYNNLETIDPDAFKKVTNLQSLNLRSNKFSTFAPMTFHYLNVLQQITLDNNNIGQFIKQANLFQHNGLALTNKIKGISFRNISLDEYPENFLVAAYDLRSLSISMNGIKRIPVLPFTLEFLDLSDNPIEDIDSDSFSVLPALKILKLNNLHIQKIPDYTFESLKILKVLKLERNKNLTTFSSLAFGEDVLEDAAEFVLEDLSLKWSRLSSLSKDLMVPFGRLTKLDLQGNPWDCNCKILWTKQLQIPPEDYKNYKCFTPVGLRDKKIFELEKKFFKCPREPIRHHIVATIALVTFCIILCFIAIWFFIVIPRHQTRANMLHTISAQYTVLVTPPNTDYR